MQSLENAKHIDSKFNSQYIEDITCISTPSSLAVAPSTNPTQDSHHEIAQTTAAASANHYNKHYNKYFLNYQNYYISTTNLAKMTTKTCTVLQLQQVCNSFCSKSAVVGTCSGAFI